jgi:hypothetical protein
MPKRWRAAARPCRNGVKLRPHGVLTSVFPPELVDRVVDEAGAREQRARTLPARVVVYYLLAMVLFCQSGYVEVRNKLVSGRDWARRFQVRLALGMQPSPGGDHLRAQAGRLAGHENDPPVADQVDFAVLLRAELNLDRDRLASRPSRIDVSALTRLTAHCWDLPRRHAAGRLGADRNACLGHAAGQSTRVASRLCRL